MGQDEARGEEERASYAHRHFYKQRTLERTD